MTKLRFAALLCATTAFIPAAALAQTQQPAQQDTQQQTQQQDTQQHDTRHPQNFTEQ